MKTFTTCAAKAKQFLNLLQGYTKGIRLTAILILLLMGVSNAWATKTVWIDVSDAPSGYTDKMLVHYWGGNSGDSYVSTSDYGTVGNRKIYKADIPDGATNWQVCRGDNNNKYNWQHAQTYSTNNKYYVKGWDNSGDGTKVIGMIKGGHIYFDNSITLWTGKIQLVIGHNDYSRTYEMTQVENTQLWYVNLTDKENHEWNDATYYGFIASSNKFGDGNWGPSNLKNATKYTAEYTSSYSLDNGSSYYCKPSSATNGKSFTITYVNGYKAISTYKATQAAKLRNDISSSYTTVNGTWPTTLKLKGTHLNGNGSSERNEISGTASTNAESNRVYGAVVTGKITHTYNTITGNYIFEGWGTDNTPSTTNASYEYNITANTTVYAFFTKAHTVTYSRVPTAAADAPTTSPSVTSGSLVASGTSVTFIAQAAKTGYTWKGWYDNNEGTGSALSSNLSYTRSITANTTIYAVYTANTYTVKFDANGGSGTMSNQNFTYGTSQNLTANTFTRTGYAFAGWNTKADGTGTSYTDKQSVNNLSSTNGATVTLYAKWTPVNYTITYNTNGGSGTMTPTSYTIETATFDLPTPHKTGYTFAGWYEDSNFSGSEVTTIQSGSTDHKTYYAKWTANTYTVVYDKNGGAGEQIVDQEFIYDEDGTLSTSTYERNGYTFDGWNTNANGTGKNYDGGATVRNLATSGTITLYAKWTAIQYTITYTGLQGATHSNPETYTIEDAITFAAPSERNGYVFAGWQPASIAVGTTGNITVTAKWTEKEANTIYLKPSDGWKTYNARFAVYCWESVNTENNRWIDMNSVDETKEYYVANIPVEFDRCNFVRLNPDFDENRWNNRTDGVEEDPKPVWEQTHDLTIPAGNHHLYDLAARTHMFFKPTDNWKSNSAAFEAYFWNNPSDNEYVELTFHKDGIYYCLKNNRKNVLFYRKNPENGWEKWGQTNDLTVPTNNDNFFTITNDKWGGSGNAEGSWSEREDDVWDNSKWTSYTFSHKQGDYRLVYVDDTNGAHPGHLITKQAEGTIKDTVSFFVYNQGDARVLLQQCTNANGGDPTWETISTCYVFETGSANPNTSMIQGKRNTSDLHVGAGCGVEESGVYNFVLQQTDGTATILANETHKYTGNFYIRTDVSDGGWNCFKQASNKMTYSSYAEKNTNFTHYFCKWIKANRSVRYTIANDYSYCISDTLVGDVIIEKDGCAPGYLPENGNVRFAWNCNTNELSRAYIRGSGNVSDRFLVLIGNEHLKDENGEAFLAGGDGRDGLGANETIFRDLHNWVYQVDVTANNQTTIQLSAEYNEQDQFFIGRSINGGGRSLLSASNSESYKVRMIYDFKVNNLLAAWVLDQKDTINPDTLTTNMLIIRKDQEQANQINFANGRNAALYTAYAVMTFTKTHVSDTTKSNFNRYEYWVSFPFDVKISDVFGFGEYGDKWILKLYDGAGRAKNGLWVDSDSYWKYITNRNYTLKAGRGFILQLDKNSMTEDDAFKHGAAEVSLYFPSTPNQDGYTIINAEPTTINVPSHECTIERDNRNIYDSHWNLIGVPGFADLENLNVESLKREVTIENQPHNLAFYYAYNAEENSYDPSVTSATFKNMYAYMVQYAGEINWTNFPTVPQQLAARRNSNSNKPEKLTLRLEIAQGEKIADQTFVQLQQEGATPEFDMNLDLTKIINSGANIYTLVGNSRIQSAGNALPMGEAVVVPVGVKIDAEGEYTFRMPDGTEGMVVELVDYETYNRTNLLLTDYTVTLPKGTSENRFALHIQPQKDVVTSLENIGEGVNNGEAVNKYLIDGKLIIRTADGVVYDAQGKRL